MVSEMYISVTMATADYKHHNVFRTSKPAVRSSLQRDRTQDQWWSWNQSHSVSQSISENIRQISERKTSWITIQTMETFLFCIPLGSPLWPNKIRLWMCVRWRTRYSTSLFFMLQNSAAQPYLLCFFQPYQSDISYHNIQPVFNLQYL